MVTKMEYNTEIFKLQEAVKAHETVILQLGKDLMQLKTELRKHKLSEYAHKV